eukprot:scaffold17032_cov34-Prasinocladus_malaysianus.AAC.2
MKQTGTLFRQTVKTGNSATGAVQVTNSRIHCRQKFDDESTRYGTVRYDSSQSFDVNALIKA